MVMQVISGEVIFTCYRCQGSRPCIHCSMEEGVFNVGYKDGKLKNPKETVGFNSVQTSTYLKAYEMGIKDVNL